MDWQRSFTRTVADGQPYVIGNRRIIPRARLMLLAFRALGGRAGFSLSRVQPVAIVVDGPDGQHVIPIRDVTRRIMVIMVAASVAFSLIARLILDRGRRA